jgi:hypothetical protein
MSNEVAFKEIWETLRKVDVSEYTEEKMGLTYLSWSRAWMLTVDHFPDARYEFHDFDGVPFRTLPDGTAEVVTSVTIEGHTRSMILPVMDYKNNPVVNPNARQVNDNRMRCLVKNLAMFGLGMSVFAVWSDHLPDAEKDKQPEKKKPAAKAKKKAKKKPVEKEENLDEFNEDWANTFVEGMIAAMDIHDTKDSLTGYWKGNRESIGRLTSGFPEQKAKLDEAFKSKAQELTAANNLEEEE